MKRFKNKFYFVLVLLISATLSCEQDDDIINLIGGLDFEIATLNPEGNKVGVIASTVPGDNRVSYSVDFGATSTDDTDVMPSKGAMVSYTYPNTTATYQITVTASIPGRDDMSVSKSHTVIIEAVVTPPVADSPLTGTWKLAPESGAFGVGPAMGDVSWYSSSASDVTTRACLFDDEYVFNADGTFQNVLGADTWVEAWQGNASEGCAAAVAPHDGSATATYTYDAAAGTITLEGIGAYLGLAKAINGSELASPGDAPSTITYKSELLEDGNVLELDIEIAGGGYWSYKLVKEGYVAPPVAVSPLTGSWRLAPESGAFGVGPANGDVSWYSSNAADVTTRACLFDDAYVFNADGSFQNVLGSETWLEGWQGVADGCGAPILPHDGSGTSTYIYDATAGTITLNGAGAYLGLAKVFNGGELTAPSEAPSSITYLAELSPDGNTLELDIEIAGGGYWAFKLVKGDAVAPPVALSPVAGTWKIAPEAGAFGVGPAKGDVSWYSSNAADVTTRACFFDDEYIFNADGSFQNALGSETWLEGWQGVADGCGATIAPHNGSNAATYEYNEGAGTVTLTGTGAYLGLPKVYNGGELTSPSDAPNAITYLIALAPDGNTMDLDIEIAGGGYWAFKLVKQ